MDKALVDEDLVWIERIRSGKEPETAFETLYGKYQGLVEGFIRKKGFDDATTQDLAQEVFFNAFHKLDSFEGRSSFRGWLIAIAAHRVRQEVRPDRNNSVRWRELIAEIDPSLERTLEDSVPSAALSPEEDLLAAELETILATAIAELPEQAGNCLRLRLRGFDDQQIATLLKKPVGTVKAHLHAARDKLRAKLRLYVQTPAATSKRLKES